MASRRLCATVMVLVLSLVASPLRAETTPNKPDTSLFGIWFYRTSFGSPLSAKLTVRGGGSPWRAEILPHATTFEPTAKEIRFAFPGDGGRFRGRIEANGTIRGFWIRPGITSDPRYPGGASQPFATPLVLESSRKNEWQGTVRPLDDPHTLYVAIARTDSGPLIAAFRNPEQNRRGPAMTYRVRQEGEVVRFIAGAEPQPQETVIEARLLDPGRMRMRSEDLGREIELERLTKAPAASQGTEPQPRTLQRAAGFFPRIGSKPYRYQPPPATADGWSVAKASDVGMDEAALTAMIQGIIDADPMARRPSLIHSMLVARKGKLVLEEYFYGHDRDRVHDTRSAGKTFSSVLLGAVMRTGTKITPETRLYELMAARGPFANPDARKSAITLAHLMTHTAGLACNDNDDASPGNEGTMQAQTSQVDWWRYTLDLPMAHEPGKRYAYCSANTNLMGAALTTATGTWLPELFERHIARPLQFAEYHWNLMPNEEGYFGGGAFLRPRDLLKLGQAYLDGGVWNGRRIVDSTWVRESTAPRIHISPATTGYSADEFGEYYGEGDDAYAWHLTELRVGERVIRGYVATGNGGQVLMVVPEYQLAVVFTGGNYRQGGIWGRWGGQFVGGHIIPSIRK